MNKIIPINFIAYNICNNCETPNIELYDYFNNPLNYALLIKSNNFSFINKKNIYKMKCKKCGKEYIIKWINNGTVPIPMKNNIDLDYFKNKFNGG